LASAVSLSIGRTAPCQGGIDASVNVCRDSVFTPSVLLSGVDAFGTEGVTDG
jgi:hypothetical protein